MSATPTSIDQDIPGVNLHEEAVLSSINISSDTLMANVTVTATRTPSGLVVGTRYLTNPPGVVPPGQKIATLPTNVQDAIGVIRSYLLAQPNLLGPNP